MELLWDRFGTSWWFYLQMAFTLAMLLHAYRLGAEFFWYWIIFLFQPIGAWAYFFLVFVRGFPLNRPSTNAPLWQRKLSLEELRYRAERMPTVNNRTALAERFMEQGRHQDAIPLLEAVLQMDQIFCQAMHDLALCHLACGEPRRAIELLQRLLQRDYRWSYYRAWRTLIDAYGACHEPEEALRACRELVKMVPTLENQCVLAEHLLDTQHKAEAIDLLDQALEDHAYLPFNKRLKNWRSVRHARRLLKEADAG